MKSGQEGTTSQGTDKRYVSHRGKEFFIDTLTNGLHRIRMTSGGVAPKICKDRYTSYNVAEKALIAYLRSRDRIGYAIYPNKD